MDAPTQADDSFFDLGGHSLLTVTLVERVASALGAHLSIADVFQRASLRAMAEAIELQIGDGGSALDALSNADPRAG